MKLPFVAALSIVFVLSLAGFKDESAPTVLSIRAFEEPLVPIGEADNAEPALVSALQVYNKRKSYEDVSAVTSYLQANPNSPWKFSLLTNLGIVYRKTGYYSKAIEAWEQAWALGKADKNPQIQSLSNRAAAELSSLLSSLGRSERLNPLLKEMKGRKVYGAAAAVLTAANENAWLMRNKSEVSFKCGPFALDSIRTFQNPKIADHKQIIEAQSSAKGFSLTQVQKLSEKIGMNYQMAKRIKGAEFIVPSVVHWKSGHYAAILKKENGFFLTKDPTFDQQTLVSADALEDEASGYFLVPPGPLPPGWKNIPASEADAVWGRGLPPNRQLGATTNNDKQNCNPSDPDYPCCKGMATYSVYLMLCSLSIRDNPVGYKPPVGPDVEFTITYNQYEASQPANFNFFNFGEQWNCSWMSYVTLPAMLGGAMTLNPRGGGQINYPTHGTSFVNTGSTFTGYSGYYPNEIQGLAVLWVKTDGTYERRFPDGSKEIYALIDGTTRVFLTSVVDPQGNAITFQYLSDGSYRLHTVTDALGLVTTLSYSYAPTPSDLGNPQTFLVSDITDPYARTAHFAYTSSAPYELTDITDVVGITSHFDYGSGSDISQMVTPYGTTTFTVTNADPNSGSVPQIRSFQSREPDGSQIRAESDLDNTNYPYPDTAANQYVPYTMAVFIFDQSYRNTYFWGKKTMQDMGGTMDYKKAHIYHWLHTDGTSLLMSPVLESEKPALEARIWYDYPGQVYSGSGGSYAYLGTSDKPTKIGRSSASNAATYDAAHSQVWTYEYSNTANPSLVTRMYDPLNRVTTFYYAANNIDIDHITNNGSVIDTIAQYTYATNVAHRVATYTDLANQTWHYYYNNQGQLTKSTPPARALMGDESTNYTYTNNFLTSISQPMAGAVTTITPDVVGGNTINRPKTISSPTGYALTYSYDNLDRVTQVLYPDATTNLFSYLNPHTGHVDLDLHSSTDRLARTTTREYDSTRHMTSITDPLSRTTQYGWCSCGMMTSLTDPKGNVTNFNYNIESQLTSKVYAGGTNPPTVPDYTYDIFGHLATYRDKRGDLVTYTYNLDDTLGSISYSLAPGTATTPNVSFGYDQFYKRLTSAGGVSYAYYGAGSLGANKIRQVTNTLTGGNAVIVYAYDEWGRPVGLNVDGANNETVALDSLGRTSSRTNLLGTFNYSFFDPSHPTNRVGSMTYPSGQTTTYDYYGTTGDERLKQIKNFTLGPSSAVLSEQDYAYDTIGRIHTWSQTTDANPAMVWTEGYDGADQLTSAVLTNTAIPAPPVRSDSYAYDLAGNFNSTGTSVAGVARTVSVNALNQVTASTPSGNRAVAFTGLLNASGTVTVNGSPAAVNSSHFFSATPTFSPGTTNMVSVTATDSNGNTRTNNYQTIAPPELTFSPVTYDADGNETSNGAGQTYTWDAKNELVSITYTGGSTTIFKYDALGHRISIVESNGGSPITKQLVWDKTTIVEERNAANAFTKRFFLSGEIIGSNLYFYTKDHLGSIREMTGATAAIQARYEYDSFGRQTKVSGNLESDFQYAASYYHIPSGLNLTPFRSYDSVLSRWSSRDPIEWAEMVQGPNLYAYVGNHPLSFVDPYGLYTVSVGFAVSFQAGPLNANGSVSIVADTQGNVGISEVVGAGFGVGAKASGGIQFAASDAKSICDLKDFFYNFNVGGGAGPDAEGNVFWGDSDDGPVVGAGVNLGPGLGAGGSGGGSYTWVQPFSR